MKVRITLSETQPPPPSHNGSDTYERGPDPWHSDAMPTGFKDVGAKGPRRMGWYLLDWCGNQIGWAPDGAVLEYDDGIQNPEPNPA